MRRAAKRFARADQGNIAMIFAITLVPLLAMVGAAVDYTRASAARSAIQGALDTAALMVSRDAAANPTLSGDAIQALATKYFNALYHNADAAGVTVTATYSAGGSGVPASITMEGNGSVPTDFMKLVGINQVAVGADSKTAWGNTRMRVAMVLDNTGSMADNGKMTALQSAAKDMIDSLAGFSKQNGDVYVSIVPFSTDVNVGSSNYNANWIKWNGSPSGDSWDENNGNCSGGTSYRTKSACTSVQICSNSRYTSQNQCTRNGGTWKSANYTWTPKNHNTWNGCIMDRDQSNDAKNTAPIANDTSIPSTLYYAQQSSNCPPATITPMSYSWSILKQQIDTMSPNGATNQAVGLAWGWQTLNTANGPFKAPPKDSNYDYKDYIVLLSDGLNTQDRWYTCPNAGPCPTIDARQQSLCSNVKDPNQNGGTQITVFTVQVNISNKDPKSQILQDCASGSNNFQMITTADQTATAFQNILTQITKLRLAQ
jgi:Flp pilus assembly protein TadG